MTEKTIVAEEKRRFNNVCISEVQALTVVFMTASGG
jgi:hypothetical protein